MESHGFPKPTIHLSWPTPYHRLFSSLVVSTPPLQRCQLGTLNACFENASVEKRSSGV